MAYTLRLVVPFIFTLGIWFASLGQSPTSVWQTPVHDYAVHGASMALALRMIAQQFKIGVGLNKIRFPETRMSRSVPGSTTETFRTCSTP